MTRYKPYIPQPNLSRGYRLSILMLLFLLSFQFMGKAGEIAYTLVLDTNDLSISEVTGNNGEKYTRLHLQDGVSDGIPGSCEVPMRILKFVVPTYSHNYRIEVVGRYENEDITLSAPLFPCQEPVPTSATSIEFTNPDKSVYGADKTDLTPQITTETLMDGWDHIVAVAVNPLILKDDNTLIFSHRLDVKLHYDTCSAEELRFSPVFTFAAAQKESLGDLVVNPTSLDRPKSSMTKAALLYRPEYYYIIVPENLRDGVERLAMWKRQKGYTVVVTTIESILNSPDYRVGSTTSIPDEAASLRTYLQDEYANIKDSFYCLLVGDYRTTMPMRKGRLDKYEQNYTIYATGNFNGPFYIPTDNYFSDLTQKYELLSREFNGVFQYYLDKFENYISDINVGRLLVHSAEDLQIYTNKLILYETYPGCGDYSYLDRAMAFEHYDMNQWHEWEDIYGILTENELYNDCTWLINTDTVQPTGQQVIRAMKDVGFASWHGHGNPGAVQTSNAYSGEGHGIFALSSYGREETDLEGPGDGKGLDNLYNPLKPFVAYSISCIITPFDLFKYNDEISLKQGEKVLEVGKTFDIPHNMGSSFTSGGYYGGVALIGNTREGYVSHSAKLEQYFIRNIIKSRRIGESNQKAKLDYILNDSENKRTPVMSRLIYGCSLIGDPELEMWLRSPRQMISLEFNPSKTNLMIKGDELNGSNIFISNGYECISNFKSYSSNSLSMTLNALPQTGINIFSIWKTDYLPKIFMLTSNSLNFPFYDTVKDYVVTDGWLGVYDTAKFVVGRNSSFKIGAFNSFNCGSMLEIENGGSISIKCDKGVDLTGPIIKEGGNMTVKGTTITLGPGFQCEKGGELSISTWGNTKTSFIIE